MVRVYVNMPLGCSVIVGKCGTFVNVWAGVCGIPADGGTGGPLFYHDATVPSFVSHVGFNFGLYA